MTDRHGTHDINYHASRQYGTENNYSPGTDKQDKGAGKTYTAPMVRRPPFLRTVGPSQCISMDNIIEDTVGNFQCNVKCLEALKSKDKNIASFHDRVA